MGLFIASQSAVRRPGVFALEIAPPRSVESVSQGYIGLLAQFAWGPKQAVTTPESGANFLDLFEPAGSPRTSTGYYAVMRRKKLRLKIVRVLGSGSAAATKTIQDSGPTNTLVVTAKYHGVLGNSIAYTVADPADGDSTHFKITFTLTDPITGTTSETYDNVDIADVAGTADLSASLLIASMVRSGTNLRPANGSDVLASGANGTINSAAYTGTADAADAGAALFEVEDEVRVLCADGFVDVGGTLERATVNAALAAQADSLGDRLAVLEGETGAVATAAWSAVKAYVTGGLVDDRVLFVGASCKVFDDAGVERQSPLTTFVASALVNQDPQFSHARWADETTDLYSAVQRIVAGFSTASAIIQDEATDRGILLPTRLASGRFAFLHDRTTSQTSGKHFAIRRRLCDFLAKSIVAALPAFVNSPNVAEQHRVIKSIVDNFLREQVRLGRIVAFSTDLTTGNSAASVAAGNFVLGIDVQTPAPMERIYLALNAGEGVTVREAA